QHLLRTAIPKRPNLPDQVIGILEKSDDVPPWTWKLVSGGGWNIDRGDWVYRDSVHSGVQYGRYDRGMLIQRLQVTESGDLAVDERGVENIEAFFESRKHMYNSLYYHETSRVAFDMYCKCAERARELFRAGMPIHADPVMQQVLGADSSDELPLNTLLAMTEGWWESHVHAWAHDAQDPILKDFAERIVLRKPFKHFPDNDYNRSMLGKLVAEAGLDPNYYLLRIKPLPEKHKEDLDEALLVQRRDGTLLPLTQKSRLLEAFSKMRKNAETAMLAIPLEAFLTSPAMH
ncbi:MAG: hypothetical protein KDD55_01155, partial [Bdellovibrionales bacterium]|nr:hypothetical protein [Bdellovibrionales bacterium]